jgi:DNA-binding LacI/PurR family transcriptional regulator/DNA-binding transcriptional regulator YhcF (GntR family)
MVTEAVGVKTYLSFFSGNLQATTENFLFAINSLYIPQRPRPMKKHPGKRAETPSVSLARRFVEDALHSGEFLKGDRLPTLRVLASKARVSPDTMLRALHLIEADGLLTIVKNHGTYAGKPEDRMRSLDVDSLKRPLWGKWQRLHSRLAQDIYSGIFPKGADLPSLPDLASRYGTTTPTLRKAIRALEDSGVLEPHGRHYRIPRPANHSGQAGVLFTVCAQPAEGDLWFRQDRHAEFLTSLRHACTEANLRLFVSSHHPGQAFLWRTGQGRPLGGARDESEIRETPLRAHIVWAPCLSERDFQRLCADFAELNTTAKPIRVGSREMPIAILDGGMGMPIVLPRSKEHPYARIFSTPRKEAAQQVARVLLAAGHRRIAFLSSFHTEVWSKERLVGLRRECEAAGFPDAVQAFTVAAKESAPNGQEEHSLRGAEAEFGANLDRLEKSLGGNIQPWLTAPLRISLDQLRGASRMDQLLREPVERMLDWGPSACVAASDSMALIAMHHLRKAGVAIPDAISFVGFNDDKYASENDLSSYNFNMAVIARTMLRYVLDPEKAGRADRGGVVDCAGSLVERKSSQRPQKS